MIVSCMRERLSHGAGKVQNVLHVAPTWSVGLGHLSGNVIQGGRSEVLYVGLGGNVDQDGEGGSVLVAGVERDVVGCVAAFFSVVQVREYAAVSSERHTPRHLLHTTAMYKKVYSRLRS